MVETQSRSSGRSPTPSGAAMADPWSPPPPIRPEIPDRGSLLPAPEGTRPGETVSDYPTVRAPDSDASLLAGLAAGDTDREIAFLRRFQNRVYGLARGLVGDPALAEDVAQETFLRAWRHAPAYDPGRGSVATWLLAITRNVAIDVLRQRKVVPIDPHLLLSLAPHMPATAPDERAVETDAASCLREVLRGLPSEQCRAVVRAFLYGQTAPEISAFEGIPLGTAKTRIRLGKIKLRAALRREDDILSESG
jgi:RNA polymerase sigma factor (sigma-70 family)